MPGMTKALERTMGRAERFLVQAQANQEILVVMEPYGYDAGRWAEGEALLSQLKEKVSANESAFAKQLGATDAFNLIFDEVWDQAQSLARLCATLFEGDTETLALLGLHKRRDEETGESEIAWPRRKGALYHFVSWARHLYSAAQENESIAIVLADFGYPADRLAQEAAEVEAMMETDSQQEQAKALAQMSTEERDLAADALRTWLRRAEMVARMTLKGQRQLLELLGLRA